MTTICYQRPEAEVALTHIRTALIPSLFFQFDQDAKQIVRDGDTWNLFLAPPVVDTATACRLRATSAMQETSEMCVWCYAWFT